MKLVVAYMYSSTTISSCLYMYFFYFLFFITQLSQWNNNLKEPAVGPEDGSKDTDGSEETEGDVEGLSLEATEGSTDGAFDGHTCRKFLGPSTRALVLVVGV